MPAPEPQAKVIESVIHYNHMCLLCAASLVSDAVRERIAEREAAAAAAEAAPPMSSVQIAEHQATIANLLQVRQRVYPASACN